MTSLPTAQKKKPGRVRKTCGGYRKTEDIDAARLEFMATLYEYTPEQVVSAAFDEQAWPFDWGYVTEIEEEG
jgi:hypothetical protein